jgi:5-methyltetrahydrofolate--homocysteine methyltransferase
MSILPQLAEHLQQGDAGGVARLTRTALDAGLQPKSILDSGLIAGMNVVGARFKAHEIFLPDVLLAAKAMYAGMDLLKPLMIRDGIPSRGCVVMGTVQGDMHDIGKNLVSIMLRGAGFEVVDLGKDVPPERFVQAAEESKAGVIGLSALLTTTMPVMRKVVELARERHLQGQVRVIVGGAPLSREFAGQIGADAYCFDGASAVDCVKSIFGVS